MSFEFLAIPIGEAEEIAEVIDLAKSVELKSTTKKAPNIYNKAL
jgi:hypothetical protein